jgi:hypothetical protein
VIEEQRTQSKNKSINKVGIFRQDICKSEKELQDITHGKVKTGGNLS